MGKFVMKTTESGVRFVLKATNGQIILAGETYSGEDACINGVESVKRSCEGGVEDQTVENFKVLQHPKFEVYADKAGEFRFRLKAKNGQIVGVSEGYKTMDACLNGVQSVKNNAPEAELIREEAEKAE
ncbi:MAG: YegP family protein [Oscillospiraceae bacterium]|nr:YegP family protein [Oscillospiraceae bacterium]